MLRTLSTLLIGVLVLPLSVLADSPYVLPSQTLITINSAPTPAGCPRLSVVLERGARDASSGGEVSELQKFLASYYNVPTADLVTGYFGPITHGYAVRFQKEVGLPSVGYVGGLTRAAIANACAALPKGTTSTDVSVPVPAIAVVSATDSAITLRYVNLPAQSQFVFINRGSMARTVASNPTLTAGGSGNIDIVVPNLGTGSYYIAVVNATTGAIIVEGKAITISVGSSTQPSCTVTADKSGYQVGDTVTLSYTGKNATSASWTASSVANLSIPIQGGTLPPSGSLVVKAAQSGTALLTLSVVGDDGDATCSIQLTVSDKPLPTCTIIVDKAAYRVGDLIVARWTTTNATSAVWGKTQGQATFTLPTSVLTLTGGQGIVASLIGTVPLTMSVTGQGGTNTCTTPVIVVP